MEDKTSSVDDIVSTTFTTINRIKEGAGKNSPDCLFLYFDLIKHKRIQEENSGKPLTDIYTKNCFLQKSLGWGVQRLQRAKKDLIRLGLIEDVIKKDKSGKITGRYVRVNYVSTISALNRQTVSTVDGQTETNTDTNKTTNTDTNKENIKTSPFVVLKKKKTETAPKKSYGEFQNVKLTDDEYEKLGMYTNGQTDRFIEDLGGYMKSHNKRYADHYATIQTWYRKENPMVNFKTMTRDQAVAYLKGANEEKHRKLRLENPNLYFSLDL